ncbi:MAG: ParB/RepB/Spo0J family partition protein [Parahaliea sp.]
MAEKKKFGIHALSARLGDTTTEKAPSTAEATTEKRVASPINSPAITARGKRQQRMYLELPVSKNTVECDLIEVNPRHCVASPLNKRVQSLLSPDDVAVQQLLAAIRDEGQRDPVLVRELQKPEGDKRYEVIYGTRRRYVAALLADAGEGSGLLKAWYSDQITDADAKRLADSENDDRQDISSWERAVYFAQLRAGKPDMTLEVLAGIEGVDRTLAGKYLKLAELPEEIVKQVASPTVISLRAGLDIQKALSALGPSARKQVLKEFAELPRFEDGAALLKALRTAATKPKTVVAAKRRELLDGQGRKRAVIGAHRTNKGQYKVDLFELSDEQITAVEEAIRSALKL